MTHDTTFAPTGPSTLRIAWLWATFGVAACTGQIGAGSSDMPDNPNPQGPVAGLSGTAPQPNDGPAQAFHADENRVAFQRLDHEELVGALAVFLDQDRGAVEAALTEVPRDSQNASGFRVPRTVNAAWVDGLGKGIESLVANSDPKRVAPQWAQECPDAAMQSGTCLESFVREVARKAFRRPPEQDEVQSLLDFILEVFALPDLQADDGFKTLLRLVLQSPEFLYKWEVSPRDALAAARDHGRLSGHERASRLSFLLWNEAPDPELSRLVDEGAMSGPAWIRQIDRLLQDPKADRLFAGFFDQWLGLGALQDIEKAPAADGATLTPQVRQAMAGEVIHFASHVVRQDDGSYASLMTSPKVAVNRSLAAHYGFAPTKADGFEIQESEERPAAGLMTTGAFLVSVSGHNAPSPTHFGLAVRGAILCDELPPPPPNVDTSLPDAVPGTTLRARSDKHANNPACAGCHQLLDPIGFAGLAFDHLGRSAQASEDTSGTIVAYEEGVDRDFDDIVSLAALIATNPSAKACFVRQWLRFAYRQEFPLDQQLPSEIADDFMSGQSDQEIIKLVANIAQSEGMKRREPIAKGAEMPNQEGGQR